MFELTVGFATAVIEEKVFECEGFNIEENESNIVLLDAKENANVIGLISKDKVLYLLIAEM